MYDDEDEIKRKRRKLLITIGIALFLIIIVIIFLFVKSNGKKNIVEPKELNCKLVVKSGTANENGIYESEVLIEFDDKEMEKNEISNYGISNRQTPVYNKQLEYKISSNGKYKIYGYLEDANGNTGTCEIEIEVSLTKPSCELEVVSGTMGENDWYVSDVVVGFKNKNSNSETATIEKYYIEKKVSDLDSEEIIKGETPNENIEKYTIKDNQTTQLYGYVIDSNGSEGTCDITIKKDTDIPTCSLSVISGTSNSSGIYTSEVTVGFNTKKDETSEVVAFGVGTSENYSDETFVVTASGTTKVYGYVKDSAGNKGTCSIEIKRPTPTPDPPDNPTPTPDPPDNPTPKPESYPSCTLEIIGSLNGNTYLGNTTVRFKSKGSTNGASITSYGIGTSAQLNGQDSYTITTTGNFNIYGMVKDSNGKTATCGPVNLNVQIPTLLSSNVKIGDYVAYDAGTWNSNAAIPTANKTFGGYQSGNSKNSSVKCRNEDTSTASGWRVLSVSGNTVTIIHAGISECYYHAATSADEAISTLNNRAKTTYMNSFAADARMMTLNDYNISTTFQNIGSHYYMATRKDNTTLYYVSYTGRLSGGSARANGVRPVVVLKSNVTTTGKNSNGAWILILDGNISKDFDTEISHPQSYIELFNNTIKKVEEIINKIITQ